jgi:hypothetical protein
MEDVSPGGHVLSSGTAEGLPSRCTVREIVSARVRAEVAAYNASPGTTYRGLVQPEDAVRYTDGFRMARPRPLDPDHLLIAVEEAVAAGVVVFRIGDDTVDDLDHEVAVDEVERITTVLRRPIVARIR